MLLDSFRKENPLTPYINTGTLFDLATGEYQPAVGGGWVLDGGISPCMGVVGRAQTYKSSLAGSLLAHVLTAHPTAEAIVYETEGAIGSAKRYDSFVAKPVSDRIVFKTSIDYNLSDFYEEFMKLVDMKLQQKKDYLVDSPFLNPKTNKPHKVWIPTFVLIDSFSRAVAGKIEDSYNDSTVDDSSMNSTWLADGNFKTRIMRDMPTRAAKAGIYVIMTAHVGEKYNLNPYAPSVKQLQYMKNTDKIKDVGSRFEFLTTSMLQTIKATVLQNSSTKKCEYPTSKSHNEVEVNQVDTVALRNKNNASGLNIPYVVSQYQGILDSVTNFNFLRMNKDYGMIIQGNKQAFAPVLTPDKFVRKSNIREVTATDYELTRALELIAQLCFIQTCWSTWNLPDFVNMPPEQFAEKLKNSQNCTISRALNSTGVWSTAKMERERLTLMDILQLIEAENTHPVTTVGGKK